MDREKQLICKRLKNILDYQIKSTLFLHINHLYKKLALKDYHFYYLNT
jgi:hypothetical protein